MQSEEWEGYVCLCVSESQRRVKTTQIKCEREARLVFLVSAYLKKVGRTCVNSLAQCTYNSA